MLTEAYVAAAEESIIKFPHCCLYTAAGKRNLDWKFKQVKLLIPSGHAATYWENMFLID